LAADLPLRPRIVTCFYFFDRTKQTPPSPSTLPKKVHRGFVTKNTWRVKWYFRFFFVRLRRERTPANCRNKEGRASKGTEKAYFRVAAFSPMHAWCPPKRVSILHPLRLFWGVRFSSSYSRLFLFVSYCLSAGCGVTETSVFCLFEFWTKGGKKATRFLKSELWQ
jgi:hypothetical protein